MCVGFLLSPLLNRAMRTLSCGPSSPTMSLINRYPRAEQSTQRTAGSVQQDIRLLLKTAQLLDSYPCRLLVYYSGKIDNLQLIISQLANCSILETYCSVLSYFASSSSLTISLITCITNEKAMHN